MQYKGQMPNLNKQSLKFNMSVGLLGMNKLCQVDQNLNIAF
jgi:hypothetical protein